MYIEPCCIENQLPTLLSEAKGGYTFFQTNGDITLEHLLKAVSYMAGENHVMILSAPQVDVRILRTLNTYMSREWTLALMLVTQEAQEELVRTELSGHLDRVHYAADPLILDGLVAILPTGTNSTHNTQHSTLNKSVILQGAILSQRDFSLCLYAAYAGRDSSILRNALDALIAKLKVKPLIDNSENTEISRILNRQF